MGKKQKAKNVQKSAPQPRSRKTPTGGRMIAKICRGGASVSAFSFFRSLCEVLRRVGFTVAV